MYDLMYLDVLVGLDPSLEFCMEAGIKLQTNSLAFLTDLRGKTDRWVIADTVSCLNLFVLRNGINSDPSRSFFVSSNCVLYIQKKQQYKIGVLKRIKKRIKHITDYISIVSMSNALMKSKHVHCSLLADMDRAESDLSRSFFVGFTCSPGIQKAMSRMRRREFQ